MSVTVTDQIRRLVVEQLDFPTPPDLDASTPLFKGGVAMDSFAAVELIVLMEKHFDIQFDVADITPQHFTDVAALGRLVESYLDR
jgi:acyl carrier protein